MTLPRVMQILITTVMGILGLSLIGFGLAKGGGGMDAGFAMGAIFLVIGAIAYSIFEWQLRGLRRKAQRVRHSIEECAARVLDAPGAVRPGYDQTVTLGATMGTWVASTDAGDGFTTDGEYKGVRVSVASHVSTVGRQFGELSHIYSHVVVDVLGATPRFRLSKQGVGSFVGRAAGLQHDVKIGDAAFDGAWNIDAEEGLARYVLDDEARARLSELRARVGTVSQDYGPGTMSVVVTPKGLALRWPGAIDPGLAAYVRDLLVHIRGRMLAYLENEARKRVETGEGYRVGGEAEAAEVGPEEGAMGRAKG